ncbi:hypothetical protein EY268_14745 [Shigella sonnei]|nr:hypothetical protein [Shigella sonnei]
MSLSERLAALLEGIEEEEEEGVNNPKDKGVEKAAKADKPADKKQANKPKLVWKQITLGCKPIDVNLSKEVERFNK